MVHCSLGVGCEQYGVCYAEAMGEPCQCGLPSAPQCPEPAAEDDDA